ncbi:MAG TPA: ribbon-helix-helix domain-containing protein [Pseudolabrys sp.]|jgi:predicted DNA-binding ribbon-helix-helix protein|nr:ribbon-helix-helix domain-containing protein [Pseudolabrys sp.]
MRSDAKSAIIKRSVVIGGHKTSVSLEEPFWSELRAIAEAQRVTVSALLRRIDHERQNANLSSAIRVFVLHHLRQQANADLGATTEICPAALRPM